MKQENKDLLLRYLSMILPYGVKVWYKYYSENVTEKFATSIRLVDGKIALSSKFNREGDWYPIEEANELLIKPFLRPMSSMTDEEKKEFDKFSIINEFVWKGDSKNGYKNQAIIMSDAINWLLKKHFDIFDLIPKGLAIEITEENNPYKIA